MDKYDYELNNINSNNIEEEIEQIEDKLWGIDENKIKIMENFEEIFKKENDLINSHLRILRKAAKTNRPIAAFAENKNKDWKCLSVAVDSGACDNVMNRTSFQLMKEWSKKQKQH